METGIAIFCGIFAFGLLYMICKDIFLWIIKSRKNFLTALGWTIGFFALIHYKEIFEFINDILNKYHP